jgi:hypothetical protein
VLDYSGWMRGWYTKCQGMPLEDPSPTTCHNNVSYAAPSELLPCYVYWVELATGIVSQRLSSREITRTRRQPILLVICSFSSFLSRSSVVQGSCGSVFVLSPVYFMSLLAAPSPFLSPAPSCSRFSYGQLSFVFSSLSVCRSI